MAATRRLPHGVGSVIWRVLSCGEARGRNFRATPRPAAHIAERYVVRIQLRPTLTVPRWSVTPHAISNGGAQGAGPDSRATDRGAPRPGRHASKWAWSPW